MNPYIIVGACCACVVLNLINGLLIATISDKWNCR